MRLGSFCAANVDHRDRSARRGTGTVVAGECELPIGGCDQLVRSLADRHSPEDVARDGIDDREIRVFLVQHEQPRRSALRAWHAGEHQPEERRRQQQ
jgi:hypothetical protein